mgnify:CR=1 FL=1
MSNTIRIRTTPNGEDKYLKVKLDQDWDFIEILSLSISQQNAYRKFCSDYGVIVGRVVINSGFGVPNAKVSVFIPLDDADKQNPDIKGLYPFEVITDKDSDGIRYNLLPKDSDSQDDCYTPIGTFRSKREVLDNDTVLEVYNKYYKFTTTTNKAGDFMIFGVPLGTYTVHVDADISNIGIASQKPYDLISQGTPEKMFYSPTKFKSDKNLDKLVQVKSMNAGVNVQPFWGDKDNCSIGINRLDFDLNYNIIPSAIFVGSIFGDADKHSINKRCRPRKKLGNLCEQVTGSGSIDMIRKNLNGEIEDFNVQGGRVIDDDGAWAYQIPMNLDYMVTDENGDLILSQDPNKGIPTRASVRFRIGMDETGREGRLRTRAKYLVPHNPVDDTEIDYEFGENTKDTSFRDLYWNKIYSVSNFITRYQTNTQTANTKAITGIKDVDGCVGTKTPFPYNRINTDINPLFIIICLIVKILAFLITVLNSFVIPIVNLVLTLVNAIIAILNAAFVGVCEVVFALGKAICVLQLASDSCREKWCKAGLGGSYDSSSNDCTCGPKFNPIPYVPCVYVQCPADSGVNYAPGCLKQSHAPFISIDSGKAWTAANSTPDASGGLVTLTHYPFDADGHTFLNVGLDDCIAFEMAEILNVFQFDFYNDWINGSLFSFLLKYRKKKKGREVFCEYDCSPDFLGGVDGNNNGTPDNSCHTNVLLDTCFTNGIPVTYSGINYIGKDTQNTSYQSNDIKEGLIKKVGDDFYYAATTHDASWKLFATEIVHLGSVFDCDWQGIPKIHTELIPTTYKIPPDTSELSEDGTKLETCGMVNTGGNFGSVFFAINCVGVHVDDKGSLNARHICEFGVNIDEAQEDPITGAITVQADCIIGANDIDDGRGKFFRDVFYGLNRNGPSIYSLTVPSTGFTTNFNTGNLPIYNFATTTNNGSNYISFRGLTPASNQAYAQPKHSYYFYLGLNPGKTGLDKMNERFFTNCVPVVRDDMFIQASASVSIPSGGGAATFTLSFTVLGGTPAFLYSISGVNGTSYQNPPTGTLSTNSGAVIGGLYAGSYLISVVDSLGTPATKVITLVDPQNQSSGGGGVGSS